MKILEMLTKMRQEQKDNHVSYLKETKAIRDSTHTSISTPHDSNSPNNTQLCLNSISPVSQAQIEKKEIGRAF